MRIELKVENGVGDDAFLRRYFFDRCLMAGCYVNVCHNNLTNNGLFLCGDCKI